jgi:hypothetical protein
MHFLTPGIGDAYSGSGAIEWTKTPFFNASASFMYTSYKDDCHTVAQTQPKLAAIFLRWSFLHDVLTWANATGSEIGAIDFVQQDEFSHDVILHYRPENRYIVFGVT